MQIGMTKQITRSTRFHEPTLQERLRARLQAHANPQAGQFPSTSALLLDTSGSMAEYLGANVRKIDELEKLAKNFPNIRKFQFASTVEEMTSGTRLSAWGGTNMHLAFETLKQEGITHVVIITDGMPDNAPAALGAARGLKVDVLYCGPDPIPQFLKDLCRETGGQFGKASLSARKELEGQVRTRLAIEAPAGKPDRGPITL